MTDYKKRIQERAEICKIKLTEGQLYLLNEKVNNDIENGTHEFDALDMAYIYIKNNL